MPVADAAERRTGRTAPSAGRRRSPAGRLLDVVCWCVAVLLAVPALARIAHLDERWLPLVLTTGVLPLLLLPAYLVAMLATLRRRWRLLLVATALVAAHLAWTFGPVVAARRVAQPAGGVPVRVMTANLLWSNAQLGRLATEIDRTAPDILVLEETRPRSLSQLRPALERFPYRIEEPERSDVAIYSRWRLGPAQTLPVAGVSAGPGAVRTTVDVDGTSVDLVGAHPISPPHSVEEWRAALDDLRRGAETDGRPLILAGDLNATLQHRSLRQLLRADDLRDSAAADGQVWAPTWPRNRSWLPPVLQLDHVLVSPDVRVVAVHRGTDPGSDHRPVVADLAVAAGPDGQ